MNTKSAMVSYIDNILVDCAMLLNTVEKKKLSPHIVEAVKLKMLDICSLNTKLIHLELFMQFMTLEEFTAELNNSTTMSDKSKEGQIQLLTEHYNLFYTFGDLELSDYKIELIQNISNVSDEIKAIKSQLEIMQ